MNKNIENLVTGLVTVLCRTHRTNTIRKCERALADVKRARTLLEKSEATLAWAEYYERAQNQLPPMG
jgi:uncharacterized membrane protein